MSTSSPEASPLRIAPSVRAEGEIGRRRVRLPSLALRFSERKLLLVLFDLLMINSALFLALSLRPGFDVYLGTLVERLPWFVFLSGLWIALGVVLNIYDLSRAARVIPSLWSASGAIALTVLIYTFVPFVTPALPRYRFQALLFPVLASLGVALWRIAYAQVFVQPVFYQRALIVGSSRAGRELARVVARVGVGDGENGGGVGYQILGLVDGYSPTGWDDESIPYLGGHQELVHLAQALRPDEIVMAMADLESVDGKLFQAILDCREMGIPVTTMESVYERLMGRVPLGSDYRELPAVFSMRESAIDRFYLAFRRVIDVLLSLVGCLLTGALVPFVWLANRIGSPGPLFYRQERVGKSGRRFTLVKFRSMIVDAERHTGPIWAGRSDSRVTPVGRLLRKTRVDELPQFYNVLKGEMSLIGPRPERPELVARLAQVLPFYRARHAIKPGITGWAQVRYRYGASIEETHTKLQYDLYYIKHRGPYLDLLILLRTIQVMLGFKGR
jgi:exopolysaccharide biosynthesis polyprenyl glycosylphosphotransferase